MWALAGFFMFQAALVTGAPTKLDTPMPPLTTEQEDLAKMKAYLADKDAQDLATKQAQDLSTHQATSPAWGSGFLSGVGQAVKTVVPPLLSAANNLTPVGMATNGINAGIYAANHPAYAAGTVVGFGEGSIVDTAKNLYEGAKILNSVSPMSMLMHPVDTYNTAANTLSDMKAAYDSGAPQALARTTGRLLKAGVQAAWNNPGATADLIKAGAQSASAAGLIPCTGSSDSFSAGRKCGALVGGAAMWAVPYTKAKYLVEAYKATSVVRQVGSLANKVNGLTDSMNGILQKLEPLTVPQGGH